MLMDKKMLQTGQTLIIDEGVVSAVEAWGYPRDFVVRSLDNNELNYATTGYYLIENRKAMTLDKPL